MESWFTTDSSRNCSRLRIRIFKIGMSAITDSTLHVTVSGKRSLSLVCAHCDGHGDSHSDIGIGNDNDKCKIMNADGVDNR